VKTQELVVHTGTRRSATDLTADVRAFVRDQGSGLLNVFVPHATAGVAIIETGAGSDHDLMEILEDLVPHEDRYRHRHGSFGHGADHVLPGIVAPSTVVPVVEGSLALGTWQSIVLIDTNVDNPERRVRLTFLPG
jgi:secondary thiamine-phosphate synthase enzyme